MKWHYLLRLLTILFLPAVLAELGSGNLAFSRFSRPETLLFLAVAYGLPVLLIREITVRHHLQLLSLFTLGVAYGFYNEGVLAHTLTRDEGVPLSTFDHYGYIFGINLPWTLFITCWHACYAVVFPLLLVRLLYPRYTHDAWVAPRLRPVLIAFVLGVVPGLAALSAPAPTLFFVFVILLFAAVAFRCRAALPFEPVQPPILRWSAFGVGVGSLGFSLAAILLSSAKVPLALFAVLLGGAFALAVRVAARRGLLRLPSLWLVAVGSYLAFFAATFLTLRARGSTEGMATSLFLIGGMLLVLHRVRTHPA